MCPVAARRAEIQRKDFTTARLTCGDRRVQRVVRSRSPLLAYGRTRVASRCRLALSGGKRRARPSGQKILVAGHGLRPGVQEIRAGTKPGEVRIGVDRRIAAKVSAD